jgi:hypothetical protein
MRRGRRNTLRGYLLAPLLSAAACGRVEADGSVDADATAPDSGGDADVHGAGDATLEAFDSPDTRIVPAECGTLPTTEMEKFFVIADPAWCLVAQYNAGARGLGRPTWGWHGGPLSSLGLGGLEIDRMHPPAGTTGDLAITTTYAGGPVGKAPTGCRDSYVWKNEARDVPFFELTAVSYADLLEYGCADVLQLVDDRGKFAQEYFVHEYAGGAVVGGGDRKSGRFFFLASSALNENRSEPGLWAAEPCWSESTGSLLPGADPSCKRNLQVDTGRAYEITADPLGNVIVAYSTGAPGGGAGTELRGYEASAIEPGRGPTVGNVLLELEPGSASDGFVADGSAVFFQSTDRLTGGRGDLMIQRYAVDAESHRVEAMGTPSNFLISSAPVTRYALLVDPAGRLWVGHAEPASSTFFVLAKASR